MKKISISVPGNSAIPWLVGGGVHGSAGPLHQIDGLPCTDLVGLRGTSVSRFRLKARQPNSFSFAIPTPIIFDDARPRLSRVFLLYKIDDAARLARVSVMDGPREILNLMFHSEQRFVQSDRSAPSDVNGDVWGTWDVPAQPEVFWGIGIGVIIDPADGDSEVTFVSAGIDLMFSDPV